MVSKTIKSKFNASHEKASNKKNINSGSNQNLKSVVGKPINEFDTLLATINV
jgi:hypothetical protein